MRPVHWLMEISITKKQSRDFQLLMKELLVAADRETGTMACEYNFSDDGHTCQLYLRFIDSDAAMIHLAMFSDHFIDRFLQNCSVKGLTVLGFPNDDVCNALKDFKPVFLSQRAGFARFAY